MTFMFDPDAFEAELEQAGESAGPDAFNLITPGWYTVAIDRAEARETKKKQTGQAQRGLIWKIGFKLHSNTAFNGRYVWVNVNVENDNPTAEKIGHKQLLSICRAVQAGALNGPEDLVGRSLDVFIVVKKGSGDYKDDNEISKFAPPGSGQNSDVPVKATAPRTVAPRAAAAPKAAPVVEKWPLSWKRQG
jgi:hypothetical protein